MLVMFVEVKIKGAHNVARILCHLLQDRIHCVIEIHNVATVKPVCNDHLYKKINCLWFIQ